MKWIDNLRIKYGTKYVLDDVVVKYKLFDKNEPKYYLIVLHNEETGKQKIIKSITDRFCDTMHCWI